MLPTLLTDALLVYDWSYLPGLLFYAKGNILWFLLRQKAVISLEKTAGIKIA